jgi:hypothetical protein
LFKIDEISSSIGAQQWIMLKKEQFSGSSACFIEVSKV